MTSTLFKKYIANTPSFSYVTTKYRLDKIDHIAHRSLDMSYLRKYYLDNGFTLKNDTYNFSRFNVTATWLKSAEPTLRADKSIPYRVFLSQYRGKEVPIINSYKDYRDLSEKNQYLAWTLLHGSDINHLALQVKNIEYFLFNLKKDPRCTIGADLQVSKDGKLKQFSLQADKIEYKFPDGTYYRVPYTFVEFIERIDERDGFEGDNADKIFDSTK